MSVCLLVVVAGHTIEADASTSTALEGTFRISAGSCSGGSTSGSYFRMILPSGGANGPYVSNNDSTCSDQSYTLLKAGTDGGLRTGQFQSEPAPAFDPSGNGRAARVTAPTRFYGVDFAASTNRVDPQTQATTTAPQIYVNSAGALSGDLRAFAASWNGQEFNQGAPKPDGTTPGNTTRPTGQYNPRTGAFSLQWASQISGGPFDRFTGVWHLQGRFYPATSAGSVGGASATPRPSSAAPAGDKPGATSASTPASSASASAAVTSTASAAATPTAAPPTARSTDTTSDGAQSSDGTDEPPATAAALGKGKPGTWWVAVVLALLAVAATGAAALRVGRRSRPVIR